MAQTTTTLLTHELPFRPAPAQPRPQWDLNYLQGRLVELSGNGNSAALTVASRLIFEAQEGDEPVAWVTNQDSIFFPPDFAGGGVDLSALPIVQTVSTEQCMKAADILLQSGSFGLLIIDIGKCAGIRLAVQTRLAGQARHHDTAVVLITYKAASAETLGSLVSLRVETQRKRVDFNQYHCTIKALKDKQRGPGWSYREEHCGPVGLS